MTDIAAAQATQITTFASTRSGQTVGTGECFDLADQALRAAGAKSAADFGTVTPTANYVWGRAVTLATLQAGDIIQFSHYSYTVTTTTTVTNADGSSSTDTQVDTQSRPHHTAMVLSVGANGAVTVWEQNVAGVRSVMQNQLFFTTHADPPQVTTSGGSTTTVNRSVQVSGTRRYYRPQQR